MRKAGVQMEGNSNPARTAAYRGNMLENPREPPGLMRWLPQKELRRCLVAVVRIGRMSVGQRADFL